MSAYVRLSIRVCKCLCVQKTDSVHDARESVRVTHRPYVCWTTLCVRTDVYGRGVAMILVDVKK